MFAQWRQLPAMAPHIPVQDPTLRQTAYEMMLHAFLLSRADHSILLALVKDWPTHLYSVSTLIEAVLHRSAATMDCIAPTILYRTVLYCSITWTLSHEYQTCIHTVLYHTVLSHGP